MEIKQVWNKMLKSHKQQKLSKIKKNGSEQRTKPNQQTTITEKENNVYKYKKDGEK